MNEVRPDVSVIVPEIAILAGNIAFLVLAVAGIVATLFWIRRQQRFGGR
jgi:hypothetical protein